MTMLYQFLKSETIGYIRQEITVYCKSKSGQNESVPRSSQSFDERGNAKGFDKMKSVHTKIYIYISSLLVYYKMY